MFWRPIVYNVLTYTEAARGDPGLLFEANFALNKKIQEENKQRNKKK